MKLSETKEIYYKNLKLLNPENIKEYLVKNGWTLSHTYPTESASLWTKSNYSVTLLHDNTYEDYILRSNELIEQISIAEDIDKWNVIYQINSIRTMKSRLEIESKIMDLLNEIEGPLLYDDSILSVKKIVTLEALRWVLNEGEIV